MDDTPAISEPSGQEPEEGTVVFILHMPGKTYITQPRHIGPEPEAGQ